MTATGGPAMRSLDVLGAALANIANASNARVLDATACRDLLREVGWCTLSAIDVTAGGATRPYSVPVGYGYLDETIYFATGEGRKLRAIERQPSVCLTITDVETFHRWRSVVVTGRARLVTTAAERATVIQAFVQQRRPGNRLLTAGDGSRLLSARMFRVEIEDMQGRAAELGPSLTEDEHTTRAAESLAALLRSACPPGAGTREVAEPATPNDRLLAGLELLTLRQRRLLGDAVEALLEASGVELPITPAPRDDRTPSA